MAPRKGVIHSEVQAKPGAEPDAEPDAEPSCFDFPSAFRDAWDNLRFRRRIPAEQCQSPTPSEEQSQSCVSMTDVSDVEDEGAGIGHVSAEAPSDEALDLPTVISAACAHLSDRESRLAHAVAAVKSVKVLEDPDGLRNALSAVLAILRDSGAGERVLLIVPESDVRDWKTSAMQSQDEVNVTCFVKAAGATKACLNNLEKCRKPGLVIAAKEYLEKKTRDPSKQPRKKLYQALKAGGNPRWELVLLQCGDTSLEPFSAALSLLKEDRADAMLLFGAPHPDFLSVPKVDSMLADHFPDVDRDNIQLQLSKTPITRRQSRVLSDSAKSVGSDKQLGGRSALHPVPQNVPVVHKNGTPILGVRKGDEEDMMVHRTLFPDDMSKQHPNSDSSGERPDTAPQRKSVDKRGLKPFPAVSRRGRISREHVKAALQKSRGKITAPVYVSEQTPLVLIKRKSRCPSDQAHSKSDQSTAESQVWIDGVCERILAERGQQTKYKGDTQPPISENTTSTTTDEIIVIDSESDSERCVVAATTSGGRQLPKARITAMNTSRCKVPLKPKGPQTKKSKSPVKKKSPSKARSSVLMELIANSARKNSVKRPQNFFGKQSTRISASHKQAFEIPSHSPMSNITDSAVQNTDVVAFLPPRGNSSPSSKRSATLPVFGKGGPLYDSAQRRKSSPSSQEKRQSRNDGKWKDPPTVRYASQGLLSASKRKWYNAVLMDAKEAEWKNDEEKALQLYLEARDISDHDPSLHARILCFGGYALSNEAEIRISLEESMKNLTLRRSSSSRSPSSGAPTGDIRAFLSDSVPKRLQRNGASRSPLEKAATRRTGSRTRIPKPSPVQTRNQRKNRIVAPEVIVIDD